MRKVIYSLFTAKKVDLSDIASPKPSRAASRALNGALKRAYADQKSVQKKAHLIRSN